MLIIYKTESVTYHFYFFFEKVLAPVNSSVNLSNSNAVEKWICQKSLNQNTEFSTE